MKIQIEPHNPDWANLFKTLKAELADILKDLDPKIEHFGSTAVPGLAAKPIIDILVGIEDVQYLEDVVEKMAQRENYIYYKVYNPFMPERRLFVRLKDGVDTNRFEKVYSDLKNIPHERIHNCRIAHIHVWEFGSSEWRRHMDFRDYLKTNPLVMEAYAALKIELSKKEWKDGNEYAEAKTKFIRGVEKKLS